MASSLTIALLALSNGPPGPPPAALWVAASTTAASPNQTNSPAMAGCSDRCSLHGTCSVEGGVHRCVCYPGYDGPACADKACPHACSSHGKCVDGTCLCDADHAGVDCSLRTCPGDGCSGQGFCDLVTGTCTCRPGFGAPDCGMRLCPSDCSGEWCLEGCPGSAHAHAQARAAVLKRGFGRAARRFTFPTLRPRAPPHLRHRASSLPVIPSSHPFQSSLPIIPSIHPFQVQTIRLCAARSPR